MLIEKPIPNFGEWIGPALLHWLIAVGLLGAIIVFFSFLFTIVRYGPFKGPKNWWHGFTRSMTGLFKMSPTRIWAMAYLAIQEAIRKKVVIGFGVFILILMFAGWYLDPRSDNPAKLYLSFVMTASSYIVLLMALFMSVFSLPGDIRNKTIYTVVTKPVYASEVVLGRILGFTLIGTAFLIIMCVLSYLFVQFGLSHTHVLTAQDLAVIEEDGGKVYHGETRRNSGHTHSIMINADGTVFVGPAGKNDNHTHELTVTEEPIDGSDETVTLYHLSNNNGSLLARVPIYGSLEFREKDGMDRTTQLLWALGRSGDPKAVEAVAALVQADVVLSDDRFRAVVVSLGDSRSEKAVPALTHLLKERTGTDSVNELMAACALWQCGDPEGLAEAVLHRMASGTNGPFAQLAKSILAGSD